MPDPITALLLVMALAAGLAASIAVAQHLRPGHSMFYRQFLTQLLLFNLLILTGLVLNVLMPQLRLSAALAPAVLAMMACLKIGWLLAHDLAARSLLADFRTRRSFQLIAGLALVLLALYMAVLAWAWFTNRSSLLNGTVMTLEVLVLGAAIRISARSLSGGLRLAPGARRRSVVSYGMFHAAFFSIVFTALVVSWVRPGPEQFAHMAVTAALLLAYNLFPPIWIRIYREAPESSDHGRFEALGITRREKEIIQLIQAGRTNQEIADELFISLATVKDYNNKLFRKCGVRNRVELANLFR